MEVLGMGAVRNIIRTVDATPEVTDEVKESLKILMELAESKARVFEELIKNDLLLGKTTDTLTIPITKIVQSKTEFRAKTQETPADFVGPIAESLGKMFSGSGEILNGIAGMINTGLQTVVGAGYGEEAEMRMYSVVAEYPAIVRFDFAFWGRKIEAKAMSKHMEQVFSCVAYKSAVDVKKLAFNDFLAVYGPVLIKAFGSNMQLVKNMIEESKKIYTMMVPAKNAAPLLSQDAALAIVEQSKTHEFKFEHKTYKASIGNF